MKSNPMHCFLDISEYLNVSTIYLLNAILVPPLQKHLKKPTIQDAQDNVVLIAKTSIELQKIKKVNFEGDGIHHPIIVAMTPTHEQIYFLVLFFNLEYHFLQFSNAMDVCFKMFSVFHIDFPNQSTQLYSFLNEMFYNVNLNIGKSAKVATLVKDIKNVCNLNNSEQN